MGRWVPAGGGRDYPLHLVSSVVGGPDDAPWSGLPRTVGDLGGVPGAGPVAEVCGGRRRRSRRRWRPSPISQPWRTRRCAALGEVRRARMRTARRRRGTRSCIVSTRRRCSWAMFSAMRSGWRCAPARPGRSCARGKACALETEVHAGDADEVTVAWDLLAGLDSGGRSHLIGEDAAPSDPYPATYDPAAPRAPAVIATIRVQDENVAVRLPFDAAPVVLPGRTAVLSPEAVVLNRRRPMWRAPHRRARRRAGGRGGGADAARGMERRREGDSIAVSPPGDVAEGLYRLPLTLDGRAAATVRRIALSACRRDRAGAARGGAGARARRGGPRTSVSAMSARATTGWGIGSPPWART
jgi:hypothetical protein